MRVRSLKTYYPWLGLWGVSAVPTGAGERAQPQRWEETQVSKAMKTAAPWKTKTEKILGDQAVQC